MTDRLPILVLTALAAALVPLAGAWGEGAGTGDQPSPEVAAFQAKVQPLLARYCTSCHAGAKPKAALDLTKYKDVAAIDQNRKLWERVLENLDAEIMPPEDQPQPSPEERAFLTEWIQARVTKAACDGPPRPGHVTIRRLNRAEYDHTIRDLVGIDFHPADDFPTDDVGYGFDNIGDVLSLSPILLEKYLAAAEQVATRAILTDRTDYGENKSFRGSELRKAGGERYNENARILAGNGSISVAVPVPRDGDYLLRARAFGHQAGAEPVKMAFLVDGDEEAVVEVTAIEEAPRTYQVRVPLEAGRHRVGVAFLNDFEDKEAPNALRRDRNLIVQGLELQGPVVRDGLPLPESHRRILFTEPLKDDTRHWLEAARPILERFASRAYRRPVQPEELARLLEIVRQARREGDSFPQAIQLAVQAVLVSPHFLFRVELDRGGSSNGATGPAVPLGDYELASRLSYFLWSSMPDETLFNLAAAGRLQDPAVLADQARRMLRDPKAHALVDQFAMQWLTLRGLDAVAPDRRVFRDYNDLLKADMIAETKAFCAYVMLEDRSILEFLDSDYTFLNERLARHYGIAGVAGPEFRKVALEGDQRGGVLTHASVLTVTSNPTRTSPVKRGKWVLEQILGTPPPEPPPDVPLLDESREAIRAASLRERLEQHRADPNCAVCHNRLDPLGFVFENYDAIGAWRLKDGNFPIDPAGSLPSGESFRGPKEFKAYLIDRKADFTRALSEKLLTYALGRGLDTEDVCEVDRIAKAAADQEYRFSSLVVAIVTSTPFRMREGQGTTP